MGPLASAVVTCGAFGGVTTSEPGPTSIALPSIVIEPLPRRTSANSSARWLWTGVEYFGGSALMPSAMSSDELAVGEANTATMRPSINGKSSLPPASSAASALPTMSSRFCMLYCIICPASSFRDGKPTIDPDDLACHERGTARQKELH